MAYKDLSAKTKEYKKNYYKDNYRTYYLRIRKEEEDVIKKLSEEQSVNSYIVSLIKKDIEKEGK